MQVNTRNCIYVAQSFHFATDPVTTPWLCGQLPYATLHVDVCTFTVECPTSLHGQTDNPSPSSPFAVHTPLYVLREEVQYYRSLASLIGWRSQTTRFGIYRGYTGHKYGLIRLSPLPTGLKF